MSENIDIGNSLKFQNFYCQNILFRQIQKNTKEKNNLKFPQNKLSYDS